MGGTKFMALIVELDFLLEPSPSTGIVFGDGAVVMAGFEKKSQDHASCFQDFWGMGLDDHFVRCRRRTRRRERSPSLYFHDAYPAGTGW